MSEENEKAVDEEVKAEEVKAETVDADEVKPAEAAPDAEAKGDDEAETAEAPAGSKKKLIIIAAAALVLTLGAGGGAYFFMAGDDKAVVADKTEADKKAAEKAKAEAAEPAIKKAHYYPFAEDFMVNVSSNDGKTHYMRVAITLMTRDKKFLETIKESEPVIRNELLTLFSLQDFQELLTAPGKKKLRIEALEAVNKALNVDAASKQVEAVLITNFVME